MGQTIDPGARLAGHLAAARAGDGRPVSHWLRQIIEEDLQPIMELLEWVSLETVDRVERRWIQRFRDGGASLTNRTEGGKDARLPNRGEGTGPQPESAEAFLRRQANVGPIREPGVTREEWLADIDEARASAREGLRVLRGRKWNFGKAIVVRKGEHVPSDPRLDDRDVLFATPRHAIAYLDMLRSSDRASSLRHASRAAESYTDEERGDDRAVQGA